MGKKSTLDELSVLAQFFPSEERVEWKRWDAPFVGEFDVLYVYGFSPYIEPLMEWLEGDEKRDLVFVEDRIEVIHQIEGDSLEGEKVHFRFCMEEIETFIEKVVCEFPFGKIEVICLHEDLEKFEVIRKLLLRKTTLEEAVHSEMLYYHKLVKNLLPNFKRLEEAFDVGAWKDQFKGIPAIVCGAGPSLETVIDKLQGMEEKALILAGGSTITALTNRGIKPHLLYAIDPNPEEFTRLAFHTAYDVPLIFGCRVEPNIFYSHAGPLGYLSTKTGGRLETWLEERLGIKDRGVLQGLGEEALSVTTIAFMTALYFGCNPIILAGVDLAYDQGKRYAGGIEFNEVESNKAGDSKIEEGNVVTMTRWLMERDVIDNVCKLYPDRKFSKATDQGLVFKNISFDSEWDKIQKREDLREKIHEKVMNTPLNVKLDGQLKTFFDSMMRCKSLVEQVIKELQSLYPNLEGQETTPKVVLLEMDLEEECAFQIALKPAMYAGVFHIKRKHRPSTFPHNLYLIKVELYRYIREIIEHYSE